MLIKNPSIRLRVVNEIITTEQAYFTYTLSHAYSLKHVLSHSHSHIHARMHAHMHANALTRTYSSPFIPLLSQYVSLTHGQSYLGVLFEMTKLRTQMLRAVEKTSRAKEMKVAMRNHTHTHTEREREREKDRVRV